VIDDYLHASVVRRVNDEWPQEWRKEYGSFTEKWSTEKLPASAQQVVDSVDIEYIGEVVGIRGLFADPELVGGGLHCIPRGGFLKMHTDFNVHPKGWHRRVNMLIYLNQNWNPEWCGQLVLGDKHIDPIGGRAVIFETTGKSWHGHPAPLACPPNVQRRSLALYFYTADEPKEKVYTTVYRKRR
jgi:hypothetical protein